MRARFVAALAGIGLACSTVNAAEAQIRLDRPAGGGGGGQTAPSQPSGVLNTISQDQLIQILQSGGYSKAQKAAANDASVRITRFDLRGTPVSVVLGGCEGENCSTLTYLIFFPKQDVSDSFVNAFNRDKSFGKLYLEKDGDMTLSMELFVINGVTPGWIAGTGAIFGNVFKGLLEFKPE